MSVKVGSAAAATKQLGFWLYLMTDCLLFGSLFATYVVLKDNLNGGPGGYELFDLNYALLETVLLLTSSYAVGMALLASRQGNPKATRSWLILTGLLGVIFLGMELYEFSALAAAGHDWTASGFLSAYFTLVGTHGLHIAAGLIWLAVLLFGTRRRLDDDGKTKLELFALFWHFLDLVWIWIFTVVYLMGGIAA